MERIERLDQLRRRISEWRRDGQRIAFVPTMGNLHPGHIALVQEAGAHAGPVVASIFVNPLQFGPNEDLAAYPRTPERDAEMLAEAGCDLLFAPGVETMYPRGQADQTRVEVPGISNLLCGASRPGHFSGVATVVCKLFNMVQPDLALFGEKDFQQLLVIRRLVEDLDMPIEIRGVATVREADGLAMSSRNGYLSPGERLIAPELYRVLKAAGTALAQGVAAAQAEQEGMRALSAAGFRPDYVSVRRVSDLAAPSRTDRDLVVLAAAYLGKARLIDNIRVMSAAPASDPQSNDCGSCDK